MDLTSYQVRPVVFEWRWSSRLSAREGSGAHKGGAVRHLCVIVLDHSVTSLRTYLFEWGWAPFSSPARNTTQSVIATLAAVAFPSAHPQGMWPSPAVEMDVVENWAELTSVCFGGR